MVDFYATIPADFVLPELPARPIMLSASSQETRARWRGTFKPADVPPHVPEIAVDPGGWVAAIHGGYKFTWPAYRRWLHKLGPRLTWAAFPDLPCEASVASDAVAVRQRQEQTLQWCYDFWSLGFDDCSEGFATRVAQPWAWVPTIQGRSIDEYLWMAREMEVFLGSQQMEAEWLATATSDELEDAVQLTDITPKQARAWGAKTVAHRRIGIGSLCKRPADEVVPIVRAIVEVLPNERFHLWGIDIRALRRLQAAGLMPWVASFDSSSWNGRFGRDIAKIDAERAALGLRQVDHAVRLLLPRRQARVEAILESSYQLELAM